jgi:hypothetical protein
MPKASLFHLAGQVCECGFSGTCLRHPPSAYNSFALLDKFDTLNIRKGLDMDTIQDDSADGTGLGLVQFLTYAGARGYVKQGTIAGNEVGLHKNTSSNSRGELENQVCHGLRFGGDKQTLRKLDAGKQNWGCEREGIHRSLQEFYRYV